MMYDCLGGKVGGRDGKHTHSPLLLFELRSWARGDYLRWSSDRRIVAVKKLKGE